MYLDSCFAIEHRMSSYTNASLEIFKRHLRESAYAFVCQVSIMEFFCEDSSLLNFVNSFRKKLHHRCLTWLSMRFGKVVPQNSSTNIFLFPRKIHEKCFTFVGCREEFY